MNPQPANRCAARSTAYAARFVLWLFAALALADFAPASAESSRFAKYGFVRDEIIAALPHAGLPADEAAVVATDSDSLPEPAVSGSDPALDADDATAASRLPPRTACAAPGAIAITWCPDGQPFAAFNSRAPPLNG